MGRDCMSVFLSANWMKAIKFALKSPQTEPDAIEIISQKGESAAAWPPHWAETEPVDLLSTHAW